MAPRKSKSPKGASAPSHKKKKPKIVDDVDDSDDEEIDEDEAFNSEDERKYGAFFNKKEKKAGSDDEDVTSDDDDDGSGDSEEDEEDDGGQYMLDLLNKLESVKKTGDNTADTDASHMAKLPESEFSSSINKKGLTMDNLMEGLQDTQGFATLQKAFAQEGAATPAPLAKVLADRTQRQMVYVDQSKRISAWTTAVQENRQAETLDFKPKQRLEVTRDTLVDKFEATTEFEKEIEQALEEAGLQDEEAILKAEEAALQDDLGANRLTMEEYKKRRGQLAQMRALLFYHEQKRHHIKKIKSKKYRRIRKKQRERLQESILGAAVEEDDDLADELKEKEEVARIQERMTLAHKNTSKWAQRILKRGKNVDVDTRRALSAQLKRGDDLRKKMMGDQDNSDADSGEEDLVESARKVLADTSEDADPTNGKTGLFNLAFMKKGILKQRERAHEEARKLLSELEANERDDYDEAVKDDEATPKKQLMVASAKEMKKVLKEGELVVTGLEMGNSNSIAMTGGIEIDLPTTGKGEPQDDKKDASGASTIAPISEHVSTLKMKGGSTPKARSESKEASSSSKKKRKQATQAPTESTEEPESNPWMIPSESTRASTEGSSLKKKKTSGVSKSGIVDVEGAVDLLDAEKKSSNNSGSHAVKKGNEKSIESGEKKITMLTQEELVRRAFAGTSDKEAEEDFAKEKEDMAGEDDPTRKTKKEESSKDVVGWGSWTGKGALPPLRRNKKLPKKLQAPAKKEDPKRKRKDDRKPNVIINEKRVKKTSNTFMLGDVPYPYSSRAEYEEAMVGGVGKEWNVTSAYKNMTRPEILTRSGKIILPISKKAKQPRPAGKF